MSALRTLLEGPVETEGYRTADRKPCSDVKEKSKRIKGSSSTPTPHPLFTIRFGEVRTNLLPIRLQDDVRQQPSSTSKLASKRHTPMDTSDCRPQTGQDSCAKSTSCEEPRGDLEMPDDSSVEINQPDYKYPFPFTKAYGTFGKWQSPTSRPTKSVGGQEMASEISNDSSPKYKVYPQKYRSKWENESDLKDWLKPIEGNDLRAFCVFCNVSVLARLSCLRAHARSEKHELLSSCFHKKGSVEEETVTLTATVPESSNEEVVPMSVDDTQKEVELAKCEEEVKTERCVSAWQHVIVEILGPFEQTPSGNQYVISATDKFTKWIEAQPLANCDAKSVTDFLVCSYARLGFCNYLFLNCSGELSFKISKDFKAQTKGIIPDDASWEKLLRFVNNGETYAPVVQCKGKEEETPAMAATLKERILEAGPEWDRHLSKILFELRTKPGAESVSRTPFVMLYSREHQGVLAPRKQKRKGRPRKIVVFSAEAAPKDLEVVQVQRPFAARRLQGKPHRYGLRTTLKSQAKSSVVNRMLQKSRIKRSFLGATAEKNGLKAGKRHVKKKGGDKGDISKKKVCGGIPNKDQEADTQILPHSPTPDVSLIKQGHGAAATDVDDEDGDDFVCQDDCYDDEEDDEDDDDDDELIDDAGVEVEYSGKDSTSEKKTRKERIRLDALTDEQRQEIEGVDPSMCPQCPGVGFLSEAILEEHTKFHKEDSSELCCVHCDKEEADWSLMQLHLTTHTEASASLILPLECLTCRECSKVINSIDNVEKHLQAFHRRRPIVLCKTCGLQSRTHRRYLAHAGAHSDTQYECFRCKPKFQTRSFYAFAEHHIIHQGSGVPCPNCTRVFPSEFHVKDHQKNHKKMDQVNICEFCGKQFYGISAMRHHLRYFHNECEVYACSQCSYVGRTKSNLRGHTDRIHNKPFKCPDCDYACLAEKSLLKHIDMFHNAEKRQFPCAHCPYRGRDVKTLAEHVRIRHRLTNGFCCPNCQTVFKTRTLLRDHMPTHTGARAYACKLCDYTAKYRPTMYRHVMSKHPGETLSSASTVAGRERIPRSAYTNVRKNKATKVLQQDGPEIKVETQKLVSIEGVYAFGTNEQDREFILHTAAIDEDAENGGAAEAGCAEDEHAVTNIPDTNNMVAIMDANLLAEMAASGQVCVQYIEDVSSIETIEVNDEGIELDSEASKAVKEKFQMLTHGLTFSCL